MAVMVYAVAIPFFTIEPAIIVAVSLVTIYVLERRWRSAMAGV